MVLDVDFLFRASQLDQLTEDMDLLQAQLVAKQEQAAAKLAVSEAAAKKGPREGNYALRIAAEAASKAVLMVQDKVRAKTGGWWCVLSLLYITVTLVCTGSQIQAADESTAKLLERARGVAAWSLRQWREPLCAAISARNSRLAQVVDDAVLAEDPFSVDVTALQVQATRPCPALPCLVDITSHHGPPCCSH